MSGRRGSPRASLSRREFVVGSALYGGTLWLGLSLPKPRAARAAAASSERLVLTEMEWRSVEAVARRILPSDDGPGAAEAGCTNFIDKALAHEDAAWRPLYQVGLPAIDAVARKRFEKPFAELEPSEQDAILAGLEAGAPPAWPDDAPPATQVFETLRVHTLFAFLADPKYGGNRDWVGWKWVGYPGPRHHVGGYTPAQMQGREPIRPVWEDED